MNRLQILNEVFSKQEMDIINAHEKDLRGVISKVLGKINDNLKLNPEVEALADKIVDLIFPKDMSNSSIKNTAREEIFELLSSSKHFKHYEEIRNFFTKDLPKLSNILGPSVEFFDLSAICKANSKGDSKENNKEVVKSFLLDLYNVTLHFGGGNTIGKGELMLAACFSDAKLASHTKEDSKADLYLLEDNIPIEVKDDGGRLDGSGIKATRLKENALWELFSGAFKRSTNKYDLVGFQKALKNCFEEGKIEENYYKEVLSSIKSIREDLPNNPFSRESIPNIWFGKVPNCFLKLKEAAEQELNEKIDISTETFMSYIFEAIYNAMYQEYLEGAVEASVVANICIELAKVCCGSKDVEDFIILDTTIRAKVYMGLTRKGKASKRGFLFFSKALSDNIIVHCIDFRENKDTAAWKTKAKSGKLHITPSNDDRRTAHAIHVKETRSY